MVSGSIQSYAPTPSSFESHRSKHTYPALRCGACTHSPRQRAVSSSSFAAPATSVFTKSTVAKRTSTDPSKTPAVCSPTFYSTITFHNAPGGLATNQASAGTVPSFPAPWSTLSCLSTGTADTGKICPALSPIYDCTHRIDYSMSTGRVSSQAGPAAFRASWKIARTSDGRSRCSINGHDSVPVKTIAHAGGGRPSTSRLHHRPTTRSNFDSSLWPPMIHRRRMSWRFDQLSTIYRSCP